MSVLFLLVTAGGTVAAGFLGAFLWAVASGQFDDVSTPPVRILRDDPISSTAIQKSRPHDNSH
jgi:cbb3-type cytochrome oxidase maturation protein